MKIDRELIELIEQGSPDFFIDGEFEGVYLRGKTKDIVRILKKLTENVEN